MKHRRLLLVILAVALVCLLPSIAQACPNCKNSVANSSNAEAIGFAWSIVFMLAMPLAIVTTWAIAIRRALKNSANSSV